MDHHRGNWLMMGRSHLITGVCALEHAYVANVLIDKINVVPLTTLKQAVQSYLGLKDLSVGILGLTLFTAPLYLGAYFFGTLLPDIDNPKSLLGRIIHIPIGHRKWLHAIYVYLIIAALGRFHPMFAWMFFGVFVHLFWDSFSACGNCWFYKILSDYREYPNGAKVKKGHKLKLYYAGEWSEYLLLFLIVVMTVVSFVWIQKGF